MYISISNLQSRIVSTLATINTFFLWKISNNIVCSLEHLFDLKTHSSKWWSEHFMCLHPFTIILIIWLTGASNLKLCKKKFNRFSFYSDIIHIRMRLRFTTRRLQYGKHYKHLLSIVWKAIKMLFPFESENYTLWMHIYIKCSYQLICSEAGMLMVFFFVSRKDFL